MRGTRKSYAPLNSKLGLRKMKINLYRHAEPKISPNETIKGSDYIDWVHRYNESGIKPFNPQQQQYKNIYSSPLLRSIETAEILGQKCIQETLLKEAEVPLINFPSIRLKAKFWLAVARTIWLLGYTRNCESYKEAKIRAKSLANIIEIKNGQHNELTFVGHGFINHLLKIEFKKRGWMLIKDNKSKGYLGKTVIYN